MIMKKTMRLIVASFAFAVVTLASGCSSTGGGYGSSSISYGVYGGYGYPAYGYGYGHGGYGYDRPDHSNRPNRPDRPVNPGGPSIQPVPKSRPSTGMGRPSRAQMSRPARTPRMGRGRRR